MVADEDDSIEGFASVEEMMHFHEKQIIQLAQMHGELIELNERLQVADQFVAGQIDSRNNCFSGMP